MVSSYKVSYCVYDYTSAIPTVGDLQLLIKFLKDAYGEHDLVMYPLMGKADKKQLQCMFTKGFRGHRLAINLLCGDGYDSPIMDVALGRLWANFNHDDGNKSAQFEMEISKAFRGVGFGTELLKAAVQVLKRHGLKGLNGLLATTGNVAARTNFYGRLGFEFTQRSSFGSISAEDAARTKGRVCIDTSVNNPKLQGLRLIHNRGLSNALNDISALRNSDYL
jgi:GNAT superfamily N-acetyltransferase